MGEDRGPQHEDRHWHAGEAREEKRVWASAGILVCGRACPMGVPPSTVHAGSSQEFFGALQENQDRLVVVDFFAPWCNACKSVYPKLVQICNENPDILMLKLSFDDNKAIAKALNVKARVEGAPFESCGRRPNNRSRETRDA